MFLEVCLCVIELGCEMDGFVVCGMYGVFECEKVMFEYFF